MAKLRIMHLLSTEKFSGAEKIALSICKSLKEDFDVTYCSPNGLIRDMVIFNDVEFTSLKKMSDAEIRNAVKKWQPDIIHAHDYKATLLAVMAAPNKRVISHLHHNSPWTGKVNLRSILFLVASIFIQRIVFVSDAAFKGHVFKKLLSNKVDILPNVVNCTEIRKLGQTEEYPIFDLIFVGRLSKEKNPFLFIELIYKLKRNLTNIRAAMVGEGDLYLDCKRAIENFGLEENIQLYGFLANPYSLMSNAKIVVVPSIWEGFGLVAAEAMVLGIPVLASDVGGLSTLVQNGRNGFLCSSFEQFIEKATELLKDERQRFDLGKAAVETVLKSNLCDEEMYFNKIKKLYLSK